MTPVPDSARAAQAAGTALRLSIEDEARALRFHLQHGARWLMKDFQAGVGKLEQLHAPGSSQLPKLQHFVESAAQATGLVLQTAQNAAAVVASSDAPYRKLHFQLLPLASYFRATDNGDPSRLFTSVFYWLLRHALESAPASSLMVRQRLVNEAYWVMQAGDPALMARLNASPPDRDAFDQEQNLALCALLLQALLQVRPIYDGGLPPWTQRELPEPDSATAFASLLHVVVAVGLGTHADPRQPETDASDRLRFAAQLVNARLSHFELAVKKAGAHDVLADELAFVFRHA